MDSHIPNEKKFEDDSLRIWCFCVCHYLVAPTLHSHFKGKRQAWIMCRIPIIKPATCRVKSTTCFYFYREYLFVTFREAGSYVSIPSIPVLRYINELTVSICIRGHSQRGALVDWFYPGYAGAWSTHLWIIWQGAVYVRPVTLAAYYDLAVTDLKGDGWIHVAFTVWDKAPQMSTKLYVNGNLTAEVAASPGVLQLVSDIHVGNNPEGPDPYVIGSCLLYVMTFGKQRNSIANI